jgi:murein L,D-transpeptidase YafK
MVLPLGRILNRAGLALAVLAVVAPLQIVVRQAVAGDQANEVVVLKSKRLLIVLRQGHVLKVWPISLGQNPIGPKRMEGDRRTPEGQYFIDGRIPNSRFHLSLHLSYPNEADVERARAAHLSPGGDIAIHGLPDDYRPAVPGVFPPDWTDGCIALDNPAIEAIWELVDLGTPVTILP